MGCAFSSSGPGALVLPSFSGVRVIHTNGYVEDFQGHGIVIVVHIQHDADDSIPPCLERWSLLFRFRVSNWLRKIVEK
jgi:hypothetical protein